MTTTGQVTIWSADAVLDAVMSASPTSAPHVLVVGQCPVKVDERWAERIGVLELAGRPRVLVDAWAHHETIDELRARLRCDPPGGWDVMFATSWQWAWGGAPFSVCSRRGVAVRVLGPGRAALHTLARVHEHEVLRVCAEINDQWTVHRVGVETSGGRTLWIARHIEPFAVLDPTYDGLNLLADAAWAAELGKSLAGALAVPYAGNDLALK
jgi:hypothetical protein